METGWKEEERNRFKENQLRASHCRSSASPLSLNPSPQHKFPNHHGCAHIPSQNSKAPQPNEKPQEGALSNEISQRTPWEQWSPGGSLQRAAPTCSHHVLYVPNTKPFTEQRWYFVPLQTWTVLSVPTRLRVTPSSQQNGSCHLQSPSDLCEQHIHLHRCVSVHLDAS